MMDIKRLKKSLEILGEMVAEGSLKEVDDTEIDAHISSADFGSCLPATEENIRNIPDIWADQIKYDKCSFCDRKIFFRDNMPKGLTLVCLPCTVALMDEQRQDGEEISMIARKSGGNELKEYLKKKEGN